MLRCNYVVLDSATGNGAYCTNDGAALSIILPPLPELRLRQLASLGNAVCCDTLADKRFIYTLAANCAGGVVAAKLDCYAFSGQHYTPHPRDKHACQNFGLVERWLLPWIKAELPSEVVYAI